MQQTIKRCNDDFAREQDDIREIRRQNQTRNDQINQCRQDMQQYKSEWDRQNEKALQVRVWSLFVIIYPWIQNPSDLPRSRHFVWNYSSNSSFA